MQIYASIITKKSIGLFELATVRVRQTGVPKLFANKIHYKTSNIYIGKGSMEARGAHAPPPQPCRVREGGAQTGAYILSMAHERASENQN